VGKRRESYDLRKGGRELISQQRNVKRKASPPGEGKKGKSKGEEAQKGKSKGIVIK